MAGEAGRVSIGRVLAYIAVGTAAVLGAAFVYARTPDTDPAAMRANYGGPTSQFVDIGGGTTVHLRDTGPRDAPVLMLLHGANASLHTWEPWAQRLQGRYRVIRLDLPGHGLTGAGARADYSPIGMAGIVERVRATLNVARMTVAGNSMGGGVAWHYAVAHPDRVRALVLVDSVGQPPAGDDDPPLLFRLVRLPVLHDLALAITPRDMVGDGLRSAFHDPSRVSAAMIDRSWELLRYPGNREAMLDRFAQAPDVATAADLAALKMPVLILWGADDQMIPVASGEWLHRHIKGSALIVYPRTGHIVMEEHPDRSAADIDRFMGKLAQ